MTKRRINKVGIALAAFKPEEDFFAIQLESIKSQTFTEFLCVVSFDSSPQPWLEHPRFQSIWSDARFRVVRNPGDPGAKSNFENAVKILLESDAQAISFSDQDDVWSSEKIAKSVSMLDSCPPLSLVHSDMLVLVPYESRWRTLEKSAWEIEKRGVGNVGPEDFLIRNVVAGAALLMDVELAKKYPHIPSGFPFHDHWYGFVASLSGGVYPIHEPLYEYRQHEANILGVTEHQGLLNKKDLTSFRDLLRNLHSRAQFSEALLLSAKNEGLLDQAIQQRLQPLTLLKKAFDLRTSDPALARAILARLAGGWAWRKPLGE